MKYFFVIIDCFFYLLRCLCVMCRNCSDGDRLFVGILCIILLLFILLLVFSVLGIGEFLGGGIVGGVYVFDELFIVLLYFF